MTKKTHDIKVGDTIEVISSDGSTHKAHKMGNRHKVVRIEAGFDFPDIIYVDAGYGAYPHRFKKVPFKVGDAVITNSKVRHGWFFKAGEKAVVKRISSPGDLNISLRFISGSNKDKTGFVSAEMIDLAPTEPAKAAQPIILGATGRSTTTFPPKKPTKKAPLSVKVTEADVNEVLTKFVKETLGIDATVAKINQSFGTALELVLKQEAA